MSGKFQKVDWKSRKLTFLVPDPETGKEQRVEVVVGQDASFEGIKSMSELKTGQSIDIDIYDEELTGAKLTRTVKYVPMPGKETGKAR